MVADVVVVAGIESIAVAVDIGNNAVVAAVVDNPDPTIDGIRVDLAPDSTADLDID